MFINKILGIFAELPYFYSKIQSYYISKSLRFKGSSSAYLNRTPSVTGNRRVWTWSGWIKRGTLGTTQYVYSAFNASTNECSIKFNTDNTLEICQQASSNFSIRLVTTQVFRDPSAWFHLIVSADTTQLLDSSRLRVFINGLEIEDFSTSLYPARNLDTNFNLTSYTHQIGAWNTSNYFNGYMADVHFVDGDSLLPSSFGQINFLTGVWIPKQYSGSYGENGFNLKFTNPTINFLLSNSTNTTAPYGGVVANCLTTNSVYCTSNTSVGIEYAFILNDFLVPTVVTRYSIASLYFTGGTSTFTIEYSNNNSTWTVLSTFNINATAQNFSGNINIKARYWRLVAKTFGTNGTANVDSFLLFQDGIGLDYSESNNNFFANNFSMTLGSTYDSMLDVPVNYNDGGNAGGNYAVLNPLFPSSNISEANLAYSFTASSLGAYSSMDIPANMNCYFEVNITSVGNTNTGNDINQIGGIFDGVSLAYSDDGRFINNTTVQNLATGLATFGIGDTIGVAVSPTATRWYKNNVLVYTHTTNITSYMRPYAVLGGGFVTGGSGVFNFGQRPFGTSDGLPPAGYSTLNTNNLPTPTVVNPASYMAATTYTGISAGKSIANTVNNASFQPDLVWIKSRNNATDHALYDSVRGVSTELMSNSATGSTTQTTGLTAFNINGFGIGSSSKINNNSGTYVAWQWKAGDSTVTNTAGSITSQVNANTTAGFSIVSYTGTGVNATVGHGLGVAPKMIITKDIDTVVNWVVYHESMGGTSFARFNTPDPKITDAVIYNGTPSSTVFNIGIGTGINASTKRMVSYCFAEIAGYSKFGSYTGNGLADGTFVYCGFRPRFVLLKAYSGTVAESWVLWDSARNTYNTMLDILVPNSPITELTNTQIDFLSNGFKLRNVSTNGNISGNTYIFAAFAEAPSKYALAESSVNLNKSPENIATNSLRFRKSNNAFLNRTPTTAGNQTTWTWSGWIKRGNLGVYSPFFTTYGDATTISRDDIAFNANDCLQFFINGIGSTFSGHKISNAVFRDPSAWYHIVAVYDSSNSISEDRMRLYVNGTRITSFSTNVLVGPSIASKTNSNQIHRLGFDPFDNANGTYFSGYMTEVNFIDGQALTPIAFGEIDSVTGVWTPRRYTGSYGNNGFYLKFGNTASLGQDSSGKGNNWTPNNFSVAGNGSINDISGWDIKNGLGAFGNTSLPSTGNSTNSYHFPKTNATYPLSRPLTAITKIEAYCYTDGVNAATITANGGTAKTVPTGSGYVWQKVNLGVTSLSSITIANSNWSASDFWLSCFIVDDVVVFGEASTVPKYDIMTDVPVNYDDGGNGRGNYAVLNPLAYRYTVSHELPTNGNLTATGTTNNQYFISTLEGTGKYYFEITATNIGTGNGISVWIVDDANFQSGVVIFSYIASTGSVSVLGTTQFTAATFTTNDVIGIAHDTTAGTVNVYKNNILQGTATGLPTNKNFYPACTTGVAAVVNANFGQRPFNTVTGLPPAGFKTLNTNNLPTPTIINPAEYMAATTYTGTGAAQRVRNNVNNVSFQPDLVWIKDRSNGVNTSWSHVLFDSVRGIHPNGSPYLCTNETSIETGLNSGFGLTSLNNNGFSLINNGTLTNTLNDNYIAWQWKAGSTIVTNTSGTIVSQVNANPTAGFSIVTYTGNGTVGATIGHGLGTTPSMIIVKSRNEAKSGGAWPTWHKSLANTNTLYLDQTYASTTYLNRFDPTGFTSSVFKTGANGGANSELNTLNNTLVAYCFAEIAGFSKFGSYTGNALADGPFVFCGFRPIFVMIKGSTVNSNWNIYDTRRGDTNVISNILHPSLPSGEGVASQADIDILSNGFKIRESGAINPNTTGDTYIFAAFAEAPFKYSLAR